MRRFIFPVSVLVLVMSVHALSQTEDGVRGRVFWRGDVDDRVHLMIKGESLEMRIVSGENRPDGTFSFTMAMPQEQVTVEANKKEGRGDVKVIQQPTAENEYTTIVEIYDKKAGSRIYQVEIYWR